MDAPVPNKSQIFQAFLAEIRQDYEHTHRDLNEIDILTKQNAAEVERLGQLHAQAGSYVRQLQANFDTLPREDIREAYEALNAAQEKLLIMRGQLEKLQNDQRNLQRLAGLQRRLLELTTGPVALPGDDATGSEMDLASVVRVIQSEEAARQSLVRKMHDGPASSLSNFILQAEICQRLFDVDTQRARAELDALKQSATATFNQVKNFIFDLRPMMLDDLGVLPTLRRYAETFQEKTGVSVQLTVTGVERRLESHIEVAFFRAVQELLNNAHVHGQATHIQILLDLGADKVRAVIEDNGAGADAVEMLSRSQPGIGLPTLRDRIEMLGGRFSVHGRSGEGARVDFFVPIKV